MNLMVHVSPLKDESGEILGSVTLLQDITQLRSLDQMKSDFVAMVSHELKAPLASIEQQLAVILSGLTGEVSKKQKEMLLRAKERTQALIGLISDLLDLSKIEAGIVVQRKELISLSKVLEKTIDLMLPQAKAKNLTLKLELSSSLL